MSRLTESPTWQALQAQQLQWRDRTLRSLFQEDPARAERYSVEAAGLFLDYSKNHIDDPTLSLLHQLVEDAAWQDWRNRMFAGEHINHSEGRPVLHVALRVPAETHLTSTDGLHAEIVAARQKMYDFAEQVRSGQWRGYQGDLITNIVNIGIGGSDVGPSMAYAALQPYASPDLTLFFVSNIDSAQLNDVLAHCQPSNTLFIVSSKSFTTLETLTNARGARAWFEQQVGSDPKAFAQHFVAVTAAPNAAIEFGIPAKNCFLFWDWVGGRYSIWSSIGLPLVLAVGSEQFDQFLAGAYAMDQHFCTAPIEKNMPVILALLGIWQHNFWGCTNYALLPYAQRLAGLPLYMQQLDMESNGKSWDRAGEWVDYSTGPVLWGAAGTNGQHAFFQLLHQGTQQIPMDFILLAEGDAHWPQHHQFLLANALAQMEALMQGKSRSEAETELLPGEAKYLAVYRQFAGNRCSNALILPRLDAFSLGALLALYEHKVFVQGVIWRLNSFDQWGVEYGKALAKSVSAWLGQEKMPTTVSSSTRRLVERLKNR
ncbi:MAG: glucose-6-phosphate isomerase [Gammaproteobacteria bacterium]|nr:glucose-6-phosphate isomerase [Gammaproteobacteria bacterium]